MLLLTNQIDAALKNEFKEWVQSCVNKGRLDTLVAIIERCKKMNQNKALCPPWNLCYYIADVAMEADHNELACYALEFMAKWIVKGENGRPPVHLSVDEGLVITALGTAGRTYSSKLLDGACAILKLSLRQKKAPNPESYLGMIYAHASLGNMQKAFKTLHEFETTYGDTTKETGEDLFSPFFTLHPLVVACSKQGCATLDSVDLSDSNNIPVNVLSECALNQLRMDKENSHVNHLNNLSVIPSSTKGKEKIGCSIGKENWFNQQANSNVNHLNNLRIAPSLTKGETKNWQLNWKRKLGYSIDPQYCRVVIMQVMWICLLSLMKLDLYDNLP